MALNPAANYGAYSISSSSGEFYFILNDSEMMFSFASSSSDYYETIEYNSSSGKISTHKKRKNNGLEEIIRNVQVPNAEKGIYAMLLSKDLPVKHRSLLNKLANAIKGKQFSPQ